MMFSMSNCQGVRLFTSIIFHCQSLSISQCNQLMSKSIEILRLTEANVDVTNVPTAGYVDLQIARLQQLIVIVKFS